MSDGLIKKKCCTCGEEKVKVLYFIDANNKCKDCRKRTNMASRKKWGSAQDYSNGHYFGGLWKSKKSNND